MAEKAGKVMIFQGGYSTGKQILYQGGYSTGKQTICFLLFQLLTIILNFRKLCSFTPNGHINLYHLCIYFLCQYVFALYLFAT